MKVSQSVRDSVIERAGGQCEVMHHGTKGSWVCQRRANNIHHRINQSQGGGNELSSLLLACGSGTTGCHGWITEHPLLARTFGWALRRADEPQKERVLYRGRWAILTDDGGVYYQAEVNPTGRELF